tara:strand:+ start:138 stop:317 length:180 start_codon:yes stop_codon:yes gene_type:complete
MPTAELKQAVKDGHLTQKQYDKLPQKLLEGIVKSKKGGGKKKKKAPAKPKKGKKGKSKK